MADNINVTPSVESGAVAVATDEVGGTHYPMYKLAYGVDGTAALITDAKPFPVVLRGSDGVLITTEHGALSVDGTEHLTTTTIEYTADGSGNVAAVAVITPVSGKYLGVYNVCMNTNASGGTISLDYVTSSIVVARVYPSKRTAFPGCPTHLEGAVDEALTFEVVGAASGDKFFVSINHLDH